MFGSSAFAATPFAALDAAGNTYGCFINETATAADEISSAVSVNYIANILESLSAFDSTSREHVGLAQIFESASISDEALASLLWSLINTAQTASWGQIDDIQTPVWSNVNSVQASPWTGVTTSQSAGWNDVDDIQAPSWQNINMNS